MKDKVKQKNPNVCIIVVIVIIIIIIIIRQPMTVGRCYVLPLRLFAN